MIKFWVEIGNLKILKIRNRQNLNVLPILFLSFIFFRKYVKINTIEIRRSGQIKDERL